MSKHDRRDITNENARQITSEQMRKHCLTSWQGGALPLSYTRNFTYENLIFNSP